MDTIGGYQILEGPFMGGFCEVYKVSEKFSGDSFALKTVKSNLTHSKFVIERFRNEMQLWLKLPPHMNVVRAISSFEVEQRPYLLLEWAYGESLDAVIPTQKLVDAWAAALHISWAIWHIHKHSLIHGDLSPKNIVESNGIMKLIDFGFAQLSDMKDDFEHFGGTKGYMAPELIKSGHSFLTDIYSAGMIFLDIFKSFDENEMGVREIRALARKMTTELPDDRPQTFAEIIPCIEKRFKLPKSALDDSETQYKPLTYKEHLAEEVPDTQFAFNLMLGKVDSFTLARDFEQAYDLLLKIIEIYGKRIEAIVRIVETLIEIGDLDKALEYLDSTKHLDIQKNDYKYEIARLYFRLGKDDIALEVTNELINKLVDDKWLSFSLHLKGLILKKKGFLSEAINTLDESLRYNDDEVIKFDLAEVLLKVGIFERAIDICNSLKNNQSEYTIYKDIIIGEIWLRQNRIEAGIDKLLNCLDYDLPEFFKVRIFLLIGNEYFAQDFYREAKMYFEKVIEIQPQNITVKDRIEKCRIAIGNHS